MSDINRSVLWGPKVLGRNKLDERRWAYGVEAPFHMPSDCPSSDNLRQGAGFGNGGSGSSGFEVKRLGRDAASGDGRWSVV
jgi:hypothetical protein